MKSFITKLWYNLLKLLSDESGCGKKEKKPDPPAYKPSTRAVELETLLGGKASDFLGMDYENWVKRFTPEPSEFRGRALSEYSDLFEGEDYGLGDFEETESKYLDMILRKFKESRVEEFDPIRERYMAENLYESGPGFKAEREFGEETSEGVADLTTQFAYEGIQRRTQQRQYSDALKRGDYATMYQLALAEEAKSLEPTLRATDVEMGSMTTGMNLLDLLTRKDLGKYQGSLQAYNAQYGGQRPRSNLGGLGTALGIGAGLLLAPATGGTSLFMSGALGGAAGGGLGSMFEYN